MAKLAGDHSHYIFDKNKRTMEKMALWKAIETNDLSHVRELIARGVNVNYPTADSVTPMHHFARIGDAEMFKLLLSSNGNLKRCDRWMDTVLHYACHYKNIEIVKVVLASQVGKSRLLDKKGRYNRTPLQVAIECGRSDIVGLLLEAGAKVEVGNLMSLPMSSLMEEKKDIWGMLCEKRPVDSICRIMLEQENEGDAAWMPLFQRLMQKEKIDVLDKLCSIDAVKPVESLLGKDYFAKGEIKEVLKNLLTKAGDVIHADLLKLLMTQGILFIEKDHDMLMSCIKLNHTEVLQKFVGCIPYLHVWDKNICAELILAALQSDACDALQLLLGDMEQNIINSIALSTIVDTKYCKSKEMKLQEQFNRLVSHGYVSVDWDYIDLFQKLAFRKDFEQLHNLLGLIPVSCMHRNRNQFLKIAIKSKCCATVKKVKFMCEEGFGEAKCERENHGETMEKQEQYIYDNWQQVRTFHTKEHTVNSRVRRFHTEEQTVKAKTKIKYKQQTKLPWHMAVKSGDLEIVKLFQERSDNIKNALCDSLQHIEVLKYLLTSQDKAQDDCVKKAICKAAHLNNHKALSVLLEWSSSTDMKYLDKLLERSVEKAHRDCVMQLLKKGAQLPVQMKPKLGDLASTNIDILHYVVEQEILAVDEMTSEGTTLLMKTCLHDNIEAAEFLLSQGASTDTFYEGSTLSLLHLVLLNEKTDIVKLLLNQPEIDVSKVAVLKGMSWKHRQFWYEFCRRHNTFDKFLNDISYDVIEEITALEIALLSGNTEIVVQLLTMSRSLPSHKKEGLLPLHFCIIGQHHELLESICKQQPSDLDRLVKVRNFSGTALHLAVRGKDIKAVKILLRYNAFVDAVNDTGQTALYELLEFPFRDNSQIENIFDVLLQQGAALEHTDDTGKTFEDRAKERDIFQVIHMLNCCNKLCHPVNLSNMVLESARYESTDSILTSIKASSQIDEMPQIIHCLLKRYNRLSDTEMCIITNMMIEKGGDMKPEGDLSMKVHSQCMEGNYTELSKLLLQSGVNNDNYGKCLKLALSNSRFEIFYTLLKTGHHAHFEVPWKNMFVNTVAQFSRVRNSTQCDDILKVECHDTFEKGETLKEVLQLMLNKGANLYEEGRNNKTALQWSAEKGDFTICQFLIKKGYQTRSNVKKHSKQCRSALTCAVLNCDVGIIELMVDSRFLDAFPDLKIPHTLCRNFMLKKKSAAETLKAVDFLLEKGIKLDDGVSFWITPLHIAVYDNNFLLVNKLLQVCNKEKKCVSQIEVGDRKWFELLHACTALQLAVKCNHYKLALLLIEHGCATDVKDKTRNTLLHLVAKNTQTGNDSHDIHRAQFIDAILCRGVSVNGINASGESALLCAVLNNDRELVHLLLAKGSTCDRTLPKTDHLYPGCTSLHIACRKHQYEIIKVLLNAGATPTKRDVQKKTPLHYACMVQAARIEYRESLISPWFFPLRTIIGTNLSKDTTKINENRSTQHAIVQSLVQMGGNIMAVDCDEKLPVDYAVQNKLFDIVLFLLSQCCDQDVLKQTITCMMVIPDRDKTWENTIEKLFKMVDDMKQFVTESQSGAKAGKDMLHVCFSAGNLNLYNTMKQLGMDDCSKNSEGDGALHILCRLDSVERSLLTCLCKCGESTNQRNNNGRTPVHVACEYSQDQALDILLQFGGNSDVQDKYGWTPVHLCLHKRSSRCLNLVLKKTKCINYKTHEKFQFVNEGSTPLLMTIENNANLKTVQLLLKHGADANMTDINGNNSFMLAVTHNLPITLISTILKHVQDVDCRNKEGLTALHLAFATNYSDVQLVNCLLENKCNPNLQISEKCYFMDKGDTVLHVAVNLRSRDVVETLILHGADLWIQNNKGQSPVSLCFGKDNKKLTGNIKLWDLFLKAGGHISQLDVTQILDNIETTDSLVELLLDCDCKFQVIDDLWHSESSSKHQQKLLKHIEDVQSSPLSLTQLSANVVRRSLRPNAVYSVEKLPLPAQIQDIIVKKHISCSNRGYQSSYYIDDDYHGYGDDYDDDDDYYDYYDGDDYDDYDYNDYHFPGQFGYGNNFYIGYDSDGDPALFL